MELCIWSKLSHSLVFSFLLTPFSFFRLSLVNYDVSTAKNLLLLALSQEEQQKWVSRLMKKIPKKPPAPDAPHRSSPRVPVKVQNSQSLKRSSRQIPPGKPRWVLNLVIPIYMQNSVSQRLCPVLSCFHVANEEFTLWQSKYIAQIVLISVSL